MRQSISDLAKTVNLPNKSTKKVVEYLKHDILLALYRPNPDVPENKAKFNHEMNAKIAETYKKLYKSEFDYEILSKNKRLPLFLMGPPGQGKTASYIAAAKEVCGLLGLNFISHVEDSYVPSKLDFVMVTHECAGEVSAITFGGLPKAEEIEIDGKKVTVQKKALSYRFTLFEQCAGGVLLFDDAANAAQVIQNVLLPVAQNNTFQGLKIHNACIGFTGNLGSLDGTYTTELSSALRTRVVPLFVTDNVKDFAHRAYAYYNDSLGDLGIINFLFRNEKDFAVLPDSNEKSGFACSRSWDNLIQSIRNVVQRNGGRGVGEDESLEEIHSLAYSMVGPEIGLKLVSYFNSLIKGADPLARDIIMHDRFKPEELKAKYSGGASSGDISFGYQFATACGDYAVNLVQGATPQKRDEMLDVATKRFARAIMVLNPSEFGFALEHFKNKLAVYVPEYAQTTKDNRELTHPIRHRIAKLINATEDCDPAKREIIIKVISEFDKVQSANVIKSKQGPRRNMS